MKTVWWLVVIVVLVLVFAVSTGNGFSVAPSTAVRGGATPGYADQDLLSALRGSGPAIKDSGSHERLAVLFRRKSEELLAEADRRARRQGDVCMDEIGVDTRRSPLPVLPEAGADCQQAVRVLRQAAQELHALALFHERMAQDEAAISTRL